SISFNGGQSWSSQDNQPTAQFYRINADNLFPYNLYAGQQDNTSVKLASMGSSWGGRISERDWSYSAGGESAFLAFDPNQPDHVMGGSYQGTIGLLMTKINEQHNIMEYPVQYQALDPKDMTYRFNWNAPIIHSLHQKGVFYHAGNRLFKTSNLGKSWEVISPDLTTHDTTKMGKSGGPYTNEGAGGENYCTITYVAESPHENGVMYTGSDDGMVYITRNGGKDWTNISPEGIRGNQVNAIDVSPHNKGTVYLAVHRYKLNDFTPFIYKSTDYGTTWTKIQTGIPYGAYVRVVREDNEVKDLLYAGTETGFYISYNGGRNWQQLQLNLPVTPITDLKLHQDHLLASTQGRAFWILDDLTPLRKNAATIKDSFALLPVKDAYRLSAGSPLNQLFPGDKEPRTINTTMANPVTGAQFFFHILGKETVKSATIEILDAAGNNIRTYYMQKPVNRQGNNQLQDDPAIEVRNGLNRFVWDLCHRNLPTIDNVLIEGSDKGRMVVPGNYTVRLTINGKSQSQNFKVLTDPRHLKEYPSLVTAEAYQEQEKLLQLLSNDVEEIHVAVTQMHKLQQQLKELRERTEDNSTFDTLYRHAGSILEKIQDWEAQLIQRKSQTNDDVINFVNKLSANIIFVKGEAEGNVPYITEGHIKRTQDLHAEWLKYRNQQQALLQGDIRILNENCRKLNWNVISF
ncbi:MAG: glycosyl hydrolase, partial [Chitinophagaceae bacterium]|nr:glycosyl hydrolase [Chitinophagaceae bacterium]